MGLVGGPGRGIIAEGRYLADARGERAEVAFVVDENYQISVFFQNMQIARTISFGYWVRHWCCA